MQLLRTPDDRFAGLPGYDLEPHYVTTDDGIRVHHVDEGPPEAAPVLLMHGEPTWSYLYRRMVPPLVAAGHRCVAPDLVGFGRSDKPAAQSDYSYARHVEWMRQVLFDRLDLRRITLVCQDWGGLVGLRLVAAEPDRFARVVVANTGLPTGDHAPTDAFLAWQTFARDTPDFPVGRIVGGGCATTPAADVLAAYDAPFPDDSYKAGARSFPTLVPTSPQDPAHDDNVAAWEVLKTFERPLLCAFSDGDPITRGGDKPFRTLVRGAAGRHHPTIEGAGHFLQEDAGERLADVVLGLIAES